MARRCQISGLKHQSGHQVSHAKNKTKRKFAVNLQSKRVYIPSEKRYVTVRISTRMLRTIDKLGIEGALRKYAKSAADLA